MTAPVSSRRGTSVAFALRLARREARTAVRRVGVFTMSIALGVGTLVAIHSFRADVSRSLDEQAHELMGSDARLGGGAPLPPDVVRVVDSLAARGTGTASVTTSVSMIMAPRTERVRLLQVKAVEGPWPFYGTVSTTPAGRWQDLAREGSALVDPAVLIQLGVAVGDTLIVGETRVRIEATVEDLPTDLGFQAAVGPRVWISGATLQAARLLGVGSLARYETHLQFPGEGDAGVVWTRYAETFRDPGVEYTTAGEQARALTDAVDFLARYLGLVGLAALLLGGVGVAGAVHTWVEEKLSDVAVLRCIGARQWTAFNAYLVQAAGLGTFGALAGVLLGLAVQSLLPSLLGGALPVGVEPRLSPAPVLFGLTTGVGVAVLFALPPLLSIRDVPPLRALRRDAESRARAGTILLRTFVYVLLAVAVTALSIFEAGSVRDGLAFAAGLAVATFVLGVTARLVARSARALLPAGAPWVVRQGVSNLYRPRNQTVSVTLALGFGAFVVGTVLQVQSSLADRFALDSGDGRPDLILFDIQPDQLDGVLALLPAGSRRTASVSPVVPARIAAIGGRTGDELLADTAGTRPERWALRREYRNTYRWELSDTEEIVEGRWFARGVGEEEGGGSGTADGSAVPISMEVDVAEDLGVGVGDTVTWDVGGRAVESVVTSLRRVDWERFATNFFVVFRPGALEAAPQMSVVLARVPDAESRAELQSALVRSYPNVSALDLARVQEAVMALAARVDRVIRFLAAFCAVAGLVVLAGALASSRRRRFAESALLRTLGARRDQVRNAVLAEYVALGAVASATGLLLALAASALLVRGVFEIPFSPSARVALVVWSGVTLLTVAAGMLGSRGVTTRPPLPALREAEG